MRGFKKDRENSIERSPEEREGGKSEKCPGKIPRALWRVF
jgi:hypothetical protein